jgi:hypothetical protein
MTSTGTAGSRKRGPAARSEVNGKLRTIKLTAKPVAGLELKDCPKELPSTFSWDGARIQARVAEQDPRVTGDLYRLLESVIGEGNAELIRKKVLDKKVDPGEELMIDVLNDITSHYGTGLGESSASAQP